MESATKNKFLIFKITWTFLLLGAVCDYVITDKFSLGFFSINLPFSSVTAVIYLLAFVFVYPLREVVSIFKIKFNNTNLILIFLLLIMAYISSYFSVMPKFAITTTTTRYLLYFFIFLATILYYNFFQEAGKFILKSFVYINILVAVSSLADYFIPGFNRLLIESFGHMENKHSALKIGDIIYPRPSGLVTDTNLTAFSITFSSFLLMLNLKNFNKYFIYSFYILCGISFGMLASRSSLITITFFFACILVFKLAAGKKAIILILIFYAVQLITPQTQARILQLFDDKNRIEEMEIGRPLVWKAAFIAMKMKSGVGIGSGVFFKQSDLYISKVKGEISENKFNEEITNPNHVPEEGINPHNIFFVMFIEYGIPGLILFLVLVFYNFFEIILKKKKYVTLIGMLGILFVSSLSNYVPYYKYYLLILIIFYVSINSNLILNDDVRQNK
jgi:O-antigen ligase